MNKGVIIVLVIVAAVVIGLPLASKLKQPAEPADSQGDDTPAATSEPSSSAAPAPAPMAAPAFDANSLVNTTWAMKVDGVSLNVTFFQGGVLQAQSPMLRALVGTDTVQGQWSASGANINVSASAGGKSVSETAVISGDQLLVKGQPAQRIR